MCIALEVIEHVLFLLQIAMDNLIVHVRIFFHIPFTMHYHS